MPSVRIRVGMRVLQLEAGTRPLGRGELLDLPASWRLLDELRATPIFEELRPLIAALGVHSEEWDEELARLLRTELQSGRLRVRRIEARSTRVLGTTELAPEEDEAVQNEIAADTHSVEIILIDAEGNPVVGEPYRIRLPDGSERSGQLDEEGRARVTGIEEAGTCQVCFPRRDAAIWQRA